MGAEIGNLVSEYRRKTGRASSSPALVLFGRELPTGSPRLALLLVATRVPRAQSTLVGGEAVLFVLPHGRASACEFSIRYPPHGHKAQSRVSFIDNQGERLVSLPYSFVLIFSDCFRTWVGGERLYCPVPRCPKCGTLVFIWRFIASCFMG